MIEICQNQYKGTKKAHIQIYGEKNISFSSNQYFKNISPPSEPRHPLVLNILIVNCPLEKNSENASWHLYG